MRSQNIIEQMKGFKNSFTGNIDNMFSPLSSMGKDIKKTYKDFLKKEGSGKKLDNISKNLKSLEKKQEKQTEVIDESLQETNELLSDIGKIQSDLYKSNSFLVKQIVNSNKTFQGIGDSLESTVIKSFDNFKNDNLRTYDSLEEQRKSFDNFQKQLSNNFKSDNQILKDILSINSKDLDFSHESQTKLSQIFDSIKSDLNSEKANTSLINISSSLDVMNSREERTYQAIELIRQNAELERQNKQKEKDDRNQNAIMKLSKIISGLGSLMGIGGLGSIVPLIFNGSKTLFGYVKMLPKITSELFTRLSSMASETLSVLGKGVDWIKNLGKEGVEVGKNVMSQGRNLLGNVWNFAKELGGKALNFGKNVGGKALQSAKNFGARGLGLATVGISGSYGLAKGFEDTEKIMGKEGKEFGALDVINAGGVQGLTTIANTLSLGSLNLKPENVQQKISGSLDSLMQTKTTAPIQKPKKDTTSNLSMLGKPLQNMPVSSGFGWRTHPIYGTKKFHRGADFAVASGTPIFAPFDGKVLFSGDGGTAGKLTVLSHAGGLTTKYMHQSSLNVKAGDLVKVGQKIGAVGSTGASTGSHLHWETWLNGEPVNPAGIKYSYQPVNNQSVGSNMKTKKKGGMGGDNFTKEELNQLDSYSFMSNNLTSLSNSISSSIPQQSTINNSIIDNLSKMANGYSNNLPINDLLNKIPDISGLLKNTINNLPNDLNQLANNTINQIPFLGDTISYFLKEFPDIKTFASGLINDIPMIKEFSSMIPNNVSDVLNGIKNVLPKDIQSLINNPNQLIDKIKGFIPKDIESLIPKDLIDKGRNLFNKGYEIYTKGTEIYNSMPEFVKNNIPKSLNDIPSFATNITSKLSGIMNNPMSLIDIGKDILPDLINSPIMSGVVDNVKNSISSIFTNFFGSSQTTSPQASVQRIDNFTLDRQMTDETLKQGSYLKPTQSVSSKSQSPIVIQPSQNKGGLQKSYAVEDMKLAIITSGVLD